MIVLRPLYYLQLSKDDGIKIDITLMESQNATSGANVSLLIGQMQQDVGY